MNNRFFTVFLALVLFHPCPAFSQFEEEDFLKAGDWVVTAAKKAQPISEAPAAVTVITEEDIRQSGAFSIPEILRVAAGLDVVTLTAFDSEVGIRGFGMNMNNKILVLIDGRTVYQEVFGCTVWEALPIELEDIERIEVVRGPVSALYGANAFSGVINIITKSPGEKGEVWASGGGGRYGHYFGSLGFGAKEGKLGFRASAGYEQAAMFADHDQESERARRFWTKFDYQLGEKSSAVFEAGKSGGKGQMFVLAPGGLSEFQDWFTRGKYRRKDLEISSFLRYGDFSLAAESFGFPTELLGADVLKEFKAGYYTYDLEVQQSFNLQRAGNLLAGLSYRSLFLDAEFLAEDNLNRYSGFFQHELRPFADFSSNLGLRIDYQDFTGVTLSPRLALNISPRPEHNLRFSVGTAYRYPSCIDLFTGTTISIIKMIPNKDLKPERLISVEMGYRTVLLERLRAGLNFFYNDMNDFIENFSLADDPAFPGLAVTNTNNGRARAFGGEVELDYQITSYLKGLFNYAYQYFDYEDMEIIKRDPDHKINGGLRLSLKNGFSAQALLHWVGPVQKPYLAALLPPDWPVINLDSYLLLNARVAYRFWDDRLEAAVSGQNLLDAENWGGRDGNSPGLYNDPGADRIPLTVMGNITARF
jgi:iron complex outermembrane receptor protein